MRIFFLETYHFRKHLADYHLRLSGCVSVEIDKLIYIKHYKSLIITILGTFSPLPELHAKSRVKAGRFAHIF